MNDHIEIQKSPAVAYLLWFFLGSFGAHRFYMGRMGSGLGMAGLLVGSVITAVFLIGLLGLAALFVWWLVDAFLINQWLKPAGVDVSSTEGAPAQLREAA